MPRKTRFFLPGVPVHVIQRGNNRQPVFFGPDDYRFYLERLREASLAHGCRVHAYCQMTNHIHLLVTPEDRDSISAALQALGRRFVPYINHAYGRSGTLWEGRFKASVVQQDAYLLACCRYIEINPVRAGITKRGQDHEKGSARKGVSTLFLPSTPFPPSTTDGDEPIGSLGFCGCENDANSSRRHRSFKPTQQRRGFRPH